MRSRAFQKWKTRFARDESGATAIEYGLIMALVFLVILGAVTAFAGKNSEKFELISTAILEAG